MRAQHPFQAVFCGLILMLAAVPASALSFHGAGVKGSGDLETREMQLDTFHAIELGGAFDVEISFGDVQQVKVTIDNNLWDLLQAEVQGGELELGWEKTVRPSDDCRVAIIVKSLDRMTVSGAGDVQIRGFDGDRFSFQLSGAADLEMDGRLDDLAIHVSGAGNIDTRRLKARNVEVHISGAGDADVYASESIDADVSGVGHISLYGKPEHRKLQTSGLGHISEEE